ncbi:MAG: DNA repair protein RecN [Acidimicrobiia bacterium]
MLEEVVVTNLGLIPKATLEPAPGLTVITGETGAGKTVMLGALRLLVGEQAPKGLIGPHGEQADVSARFVGKEEQVARRIVTPSRSKAYLDGAITTASALREVIGPQISIVGQHDQHTITSANGVRRLLDVALNEEERESARQYEEAWSVYETVRSEADLLGSDQRSLARELETLRFQVSEITEAGFEPGDERELRDRVNRLRNSEILATAVDTAITGLGDEGAGAPIAQAARALTGAAELDGSLAELATQVSDTLTMVSDIRAEIARYASDLEVDPAALQQTEERVSLLSSLKRKYGDSLEAILTFRETAAVRETELAELLESADDIAVRLREASDGLGVQGDALRSARQKAATRITEAATMHLEELGFATPVVEILLGEAPPTRNGADTATVVFASDAELVPGPIASIASGGELSRLVLALTLASGGADSDIVAFDEIDSGIGGTTALAMGRKLASLAEGRQVICVTHLPQVAAFADRHYVVARTGATTSISESIDDARVEELSRMLAGLTSSEKGKDHAEELLALAAESKSGERRLLAES